ncbi:MAG: SPOR domain-containing protein [Rhodospirillales bacterium]
MRATKFLQRRALCAPVLAAAVLTGGCALPVGVQVAIFAFDGFTLAATDKSIISHGISAASGQDCALHRVITADEGVPICNNGDDSVMTATADDLWTPKEDDGTADDESVTAAADPEADAFAATDRLDEAAAEETAVAETDAVDAADTAVETDVAALAPPTAESEGAAAADAGVEIDTLLHKADIIDGRYIVIGTYRTMEAAERLALKRRTFEPRVLVTELRSGELYRVVVGPYAEGERRTLAKTLARAGMFDVWAMGVTAEDWPDVWAPALSAQVAATK